VAGAVRGLIASSGTATDVDSFIKHLTIREVKSVELTSPPFSAATLFAPV
jgi:hypothetical protein